MHLSASFLRPFHAHNVWLAFVLCLFGSLGAVSANAQTVPVISGAPGPTQAGKPFSFRPTVSNPSNIKLSYSIWSKPAWAKFDPATGTLSGTPTTAGTWDYVLINATYSDQRILGPYFSVVVVKSTSNSAPTISGSPATSVGINQAYSFQPTARDANGDALSFSISNKPTWATFNTGSGRLSGTPTAAATHSNIVIKVSDGKATASLPAFTISVSAAANRAPTISGTPATAINANSAYSFRPTAADADGDALAFSIANKPAWATFSTSTGQLAGTPAAADVGSYSGIVISASDGKTSVSLPAFAISVNQVSLGSATLMWTPPTQNTDGSALANLAGHRIYYGTSPSALTQTVQISNQSVSTYVIENLAPATYYFAVKAYTTTGAESASSNIASKIVQ